MAERVSEQERAAFRNSVLDDVTGLEVEVEGGILGDNHIWPITRKGCEKFMDRLRDRGYLIVRHED